MNLLLNRVHILILLAIAAALVLVIDVNPPTIEGDGVSYLLPIHNFVKGEGYSFLGQPHTDYAPGYGILAYVAYIFVRDIEISGLVVSALAYLLSVYVIYRGTTDLFGERAAFFAAFFAALSPVFVQHAASTLTEPTYCLFYLLSFFLYIQIVTRKAHLWHYAALGALLGFAYLLRPEAFLPGVLATGSIILLGRRQLRAYLPVLTFALVCAPYLIFLHAHLDEWTLAGKAADPLIFYGEMYEGTPERELIARREADPEYFEQSIVDYLRLRGFDLLPRFRQNAGWIVAQMLGNVRHAALALGMAVLFKTRVDFRAVLTHEHRFRVGLAFLIFLSPVPVYLLYFVTYRFMLPYSLLLLILAGALIDLLLPRNLMMRYGIAAVSVLVLFSPFPMYRSIALDEVLTPVVDGNNSRYIGDWLHDNLDLQDKTIAGIGKLHVISFYASGRQPLENDYRELPAEIDLIDIAPLMNAAEIDYLILEGAYMRARPQLQPLWDDPASARTLGLSTVHLDPDGIFQIYRVN